MKAALQEWLWIKADYIEQSRDKVRGAMEARGLEYEQKGVDDPRLFPFSSSTAYHVWHGALDKTDLNGRDREANRHSRHVHTLRKFFRSQIATLIPVDVVEAMMGHRGYLTETYRK